MYHRASLGVDENIQPISPNSGSQSVYSAALGTSTDCTNAEDEDESVMAICVNARYVDWFVSYNVSTVVHLDLL